MSSANNSDERPTSPGLARESPSLPGLGPLQPPHDPATPSALPDHSLSPVQHPRQKQHPGPPPIAIRFVPNDEWPRRKRRRIGAACRTCSKRKTRCSGEKPICRTCSQKGHICLGYTAQGPVPTGKTPSADGADGEELSDGPSQVLRSHSPPSTQLPHRMPYFRYFGPTAIVPGYKQMVVEVKEHRSRYSSHSMSANPSASPSSAFGSLANPSSTPTIPAGVTVDSLEGIPFYDPNDPAPNNSLVLNLVEAFFLHLGCNFPFLRREVFTKDIEEKRVNGLLVDAVCAAAARFLNDPPLQLSRNGAKIPPSEYGTVFANRAKSQVIDTFTCPNLASVQACVLLAYVEFGSNRDSGLWMFLGIAIRMAQDLGLQKLEGTQGGAESICGRRIWDSAAQSPKARREAGGYLKIKVEGRELEEGDGCVEDLSEEAASEAKARERERSDTFWAVFFLDRVIASGTGRPVTIRDNEIAIDPPPIEEVGPECGYPPPFPALIRTIQLYGRVTDLLNSIKDLHTVTPRTLQRLSGVEADLTKFYQRLSPELHFGVSNFQHYASINQGAVFLLLHFWFHTMIVLLHQPTLLIAFEGIQQLSPNSRELSMSSAKTIADILAFAELVDPKAVNGNPFTSQPIYIAACAFLQESAVQSSSNPTLRLSPTFNELNLCGMASESTSNASRPPTDQGPPWKGANSDSQSKVTEEEESLAQNLTTKHALLAQAAHLNYQRCYKALKLMETYWGGVKYILTVMDQKSKGVVDPLLYTAEEMESVGVHRSVVWDQFRGFTPGTEPGSGPSGSNQIKLEGELLQPSYMPTGVGNWIPAHAPSPSTTIQGDPRLPIGWFMAGNTGSPHSNLAFMFPANAGSNDPSRAESGAGGASAPIGPAGEMCIDDGGQSVEGYGFAIEAERECMTGDLLGLVPDYYYAGECIV